jgi:hypothetical protein
MGDIAPPVPSAIGAMRLRPVQAVHDDEPGFSQPILFEGIRLVSVRWSRPTR